MYKTVRKGDASLQYTILPQTDAPVSQPESSMKLTKYIFIILLLMVLSTGALINRTYFSHTYMELQKKIILTSITEQANEIRINKNHEYKETKNVPKPTSKFVQVLSDKRIETSTFSTIILDKVDNSAVNTEMSFPINNTQRNPSTIPKQMLSSDSEPIEINSDPPTTIFTKTTPRKKKPEKISQDQEIYKDENSGHMPPSDIFLQRLMNSLVSNGKTTQPTKQNNIYVLIVGLAVLLVTALGLYVIPRQCTRKKKIKKLEEALETGKIDGDKSTLLKAYTDENKDENE